MSKNALTLSVWEGNFRGVEELLASGDGFTIDINQPISRKTKQTWVHLACLRGHAAVINVLLRFGFSNINAQDIHSQTPLHCAVFVGSLECVCSILNSGFDCQLNIVDSCGRTPLQLSIIKGLPSIRKKLVERGAIDMAAGWIVPRHQLVFTSYWIDDALAPLCMCCGSTKFTTFNRRHHCRSCGFVICGGCSHLVKNAMGQTKKQRLCSQCVSMWTNAADDIYDAAPSRADKVVGLNVQDALQDTILEHNLAQLKTCGFFYTSLGRSEVDKLFLHSEAKEGDFLLRKSSRPGCLAITVKAGTTGHHLIKQNGGKWMLCVSESTNKYKSFFSPMELISYYQTPHKDSILVLKRALSHDLVEQWQKDFEPLSSPSNIVSTTTTRTETNAPTTIESTKDDALPSFLSESTQALHNGNVEAFENTPLVERLKTHLDVYLSSTREEVDHLFALDCVPMYTFVIRHTSSDKMALALCVKREQSTYTTKLNNAANLAFSSELCDSDLLVSNTDSSLLSISRSSTTPKFTNLLSLIEHLQVKKEGLHFLLQQPLPPPQYLFVQCSCGASYNMSYKSCPGCNLLAGEVRVLDKWSIDRMDVSIMSVIGKGNFGQVYKAKLSSGVEVAAKTFQRDTANVKQCLHEAEVMKVLTKHDNVVSLVGVCSVGNPLLILLSFVNGKELLSVLEDSLANVAKLSNPERSPFLLDLSDIKSQQQLATQIATGMAHIHDCGIVHLDLASRNCLIDELGIVKVCDFGHAQIIGNEECISVSMSKVAVLWCSPELLQSHRAYKGSDVWSFGVVVHELFVASQEHLYPNSPNVKELVKMFKRKEIGVQAKGVPDFAFEVMTKCFQFDAFERPTFKDLIEIIKQWGKNEVENAGIEDMSVAIGENDSSQLNSVNDVSHA
eukprot:m.79707 g.79707  ORF g.79707 m.79707 type:complete len:898 (+) comp8613_c0_seq1:86-2779(+)